MAKSKPKTTATLEELRSRYEKLNKQKIVAQTQRDATQKQLDQLLKQAQKEFETEDLDELRKILDKMKTENEKLREKYANSLAGIEKKLAEIDAGFDEELTD